MLRKVDKLNRIVIPSEIMKEIGVAKEEELDVTIENGNIVLKSSNKIATKNEIENYILRIKEMENLHDIYKAGLLDALSWVLEGDK